MNRARLLLLALPALLGGTCRGLDGLALGLAGLLVLGGSHLAGRYVRGRLPGSGPAWVLVAALILASLADLLLQAFAYPLAAGLQPWLALLVPPAVARSLPQDHAPAPGIGDVLGFALLAPLLGLLREALGQGTLLAGAGWLTGHGDAGLALPIAGLSLASLAPGGLILLGLLLAAKTLWKP